MKLTLSKQDLNKVKALLKVKQTNIAVADMLNDLCLIRDDDCFRYIEKEVNQNKDPLLTALNVLGVDQTDPLNKDIIKRYLNDTFAIEQPDIYLKNPYNLSLKSIQIKDKHYELSYDKYPAFCYFPLDDIKLDNDSFIEHSSIGLFKNEYPFLSLKKDNEIWMCITPNEINTMSKAISDSHGKVITYGLGLGYFAFMASNKREVKEVTIVENDKSIIDIFLTYILPSFPHKEKIHIINADAFIHYASIKEKEYDYCFIDIWHDANDGAPLYARFKEIEKPFLPTSYWLENSLIAMTRRCLLTLIEEAMIGVNEAIYTKAKDEMDRFINMLYYKTKKMSFNSYQDIYNFLTEDSIKQLLKLL